MADDDQISDQHQAVAAALPLGTVGGWIGDSFRALGNRWLILTALALSGAFFALLGVTLVLAMGIVAFGAIHGFDLITNVDHLKAIADNPQNSLIGATLAALALVTGLRIMMLFIYAMHLAALDPNLGFRTAIGRAKNRGFRFFVLIMMMQLMINLGMVLAVVPGLIAAVIFSFAPLVFAEEGLGIIASFKRSASLVKGNFWGLLGRALLISLFSFIPLIGIQLVMLSWSLLYWKLKGEAAPVAVPVGDDPEVPSLAKADRRGQMRDDLSPYKGLADEGDNQTVVAMNSTSPAPVVSTPVPIRENGLPEFIPVSGDQLPEFGWGDEKMPDPMGGRPVDTGEHGDSLAELCKEAMLRFKKQWKTLLLVMLCSVLLILIFGGITAGLALGLGQVLPKNTNTIISGVMGLFLVGLGMGWGQAAFFRALVRPDASAGQSLTVGRRNALAMFGVGLMSTVIVLGGLLLFIVPGILFLIFFFMAPLALADSRSGALQAMRQSRSLVRGRAMSTFSTLFGISLVGLVAGLVPVVGTIYTALLFTVFYEHRRNKTLDFEAPASGLAWPAGWSVAGLAGAVALVFFMGALPMLEFDFSGSSDLNAQTQVAGQKKQWNLTDPPPPFNSLWMAEKSEPVFLAGDREGNVFVYNKDNQQIIGFNYAGRKTTTMSDPRGRMVTAKGMTVDENGMVYVSLGSESERLQLEQGGKFYQGHNSVLRFDKTGMAAGEFKGGDNASGAIAADNAGYLYIDDFESGTIGKYDLSGKPILRFKRSPNSNPFAHYSQLAASQSGHLYCLDPTVQRIDHFDLAGKKFGSIENPHPERAWFPQAISTDWDGNLFIVDGGDWSVTTLNSMGVVQSVLGQKPQAFDRPNPPPVVSGIRSVLADPWGGLYVIEGVYGRLLVKRDD